MLKQLSRLSVETDGRYATESELQFLKDYLDSVEKRISVYEKIRDNDNKIIDRVESQKRESNPNLLVLGDRDITGICQRDMRNFLCVSSMLMLIDNLDYLRDGILIWYQSIARAYGFEAQDKGIYQILEKVIKVYLTPQEVEMIMPAIELRLSLFS